MLDDKRKICVLCTKCCTELSVVMIIILIDFEYVDHALNNQFVNRKCCNLTNNIKQYYPDLLINDCNYYTPFTRIRN